jgi:hypothetical protein
MHVFSWKKDQMTDKGRKELKKTTIWETKSRQILLKSDRRLSKRFINTVLWISFFLYGKSFCLIFNFFIKKKNKEYFLINPFVYQSRLSLFRDVLSYRLEY